MPDNNTDLEGMLHDAESVPVEPFLKFRPSAEERRRRWSEFMRDTSTDLAQKMALVAFDMEALKDAEDALFSRAEDAEGEQRELFLRHLEQFQRVHFESLVQEVAQQTGADPAQIANKNTRTPEQEKALIEATNRRQLARIDAFWNSNYMTVFGILQNTKSIFDPDPAEIANYPGFDADDYDFWNIKESFVWYYLTTRPDLRPSAECTMTKEEYDSFEKELIKAFNKFEAFLLDYYGDKQKVIDSEDDEYINAIKAYVKHENPANADEIIKVITRKIDSLNYPVDKVNNNIWSLLATPPQDGQVGMHMEKRGSKKTVLSLYSIDFSKVEELIEASGGKITRQLSQYDKRVCIAAASLYNSGQTVFSFTRLYEAMGNTGRPGSNDFAKLETAIKKLEGAIIMLDNQAEVDAGYKYPSFKYYGSIMPLEFVKAEIDGVTVDAAIHLFREPPVITFARQRKQCTTVALKMLQSPLNKTENTLAIEDYLIEYISRAKDERKGFKEALNKLQRIKVENRTEKDEQRIEELKEQLKKPIRLLTATIFKKANITSGATQKRARETTIPTLLNHYKDNGFITGFTKDKFGYSITV